MSDVTITRDEARAIAVVLRLAALKDAAFKGEDGTCYRAGDLADLLDPPAPSLRDEVAVLLYDHSGTLTREMSLGLADDIIAMWRRHVEALTALADVNHPNGAYHRDEVLRLLGGAE